MGYYVNKNGNDKKVLTVVKIVPSDKFNRVRVVDENGNEKTVVNVDISGDEVVVVIE